jgi:hypothetical protein
MIKHLVLYNIVAFVVFLFFASRRLVFSIFSRDARLLQDKLVEVNYWQWFLSMAFHIGCTVGTAILTLGNGRNTAALPPDASMRLDIGIWQTMEIWALRPRVAAPLALLGLVHRGYTGGALRAMFVNMLMCFLGIVWSGNLAFSKRGPGREPDGWMAMTKGGLLTVIPQCIFVVIGIVLFCASGNCRKDMDKARRWYKKRHPEQSRKCGVSRREWGRLDWTVYGIFGVLTLWLYITSWVLWIGFLKVYGPLYCPSSLKQVDLMWCLGSLGTEGIGLILNFLWIGKPVPVPPELASGMGENPDEARDSLPQDGNPSAPTSMQYTETAPMQTTFTTGYNQTPWPESTPQTFPDSNSGYYQQPYHGRDTWETGASNGVPYWSPENARGMK